LEVRVQARTAELAHVNAVLEADITRREQTEARLRDSRARLRALSAHVESVREEEQTRIAREIHDQLGQALTGLRMDLSSLEKAVLQAVHNAGAPAVGLSRNQADGAGGVLALRQQIATMAHLVDDTIHLVGEIAAAMRPPALDDLGLVAAIEWQAQQFQQRSGTTCTFTSDLRHKDFDPDLAIGVFRILQEALTNVARHAAATRVDISLREEAGSLVLAVVDNGKGIPDRDLADNKSLGLLGMRERALLLGGEVELRRVENNASEPTGTVMNLRVPLVERQSS
jgi:signal transduction histidine kinase